jgi:hypothetical protein
MNELEIEEKFIDINEDKIKEMKIIIDQKSNKINELRGTILINNNMATNSNQELMNKIEQLENSNSTKDKIASDLQCELKVME